MKVAICTHVSDDWYYSIGTHKLLKSIEHFHPEIDFYVFGTEDINAIFQSHPEFNWTTIHPAISIQLIDDYDMVVHMDADSMIAGKLDELVNEDNLQYDIIGVRNNNDFNKAGKDPAIHEGYPIDTYLNCGLVAVTSKVFLEQWINKNLTVARYRSFQEQSVLNEMVHTGDWKWKILDPIDSNVYYGTANTWGTITHWDSWKEINVVDGKLILNNKVVKVLHHAGGSQPDKLNFSMFNDETKLFLDRIYNNEPRKDSN